jgi:hypothetical protein
MSRKLSGSGQGTLNGNQLLSIAKVRDTGLLLSSFPRKRESIGSSANWIPALPPAVAIRRSGKIRDVALVAQWIEQPPPKGGFRQGELSLGPWTKR